MLCIVPSVGLALGHFEGSELRYASGLFNLMRNLGGAIGIAGVNTWLQDATRLHVLRLTEALGQSPRAAAELIAEITRNIGRVVPDPHRAALMADALMARVIGRQALTLAFDDVFRMMAYLFIAALVIVPFCRPPQLAIPPDVTGH
jgi:DHA2 family multidrug resistance protein